MQQSLPLKNIVVAEGEGVGEEKELTISRDQRGLAQTLWPLRAMGTARVPSSAPSCHRLMQSQTWEQHLCAESGTWLGVCVPASLANIRESCVWAWKQLS